MAPDWIFQKGPFDRWEVIIVDNGSQDGSGGRLKEHFPTFILSRMIGIWDCKGCQSGTAKSIREICPPAEPGHSSEEWIHRTISFVYGGLFRCRVAGRNFWMPMDLSRTRLPISHPCDRALKQKPPEVVMPEKVFGKRKRLFWTGWSRFSDRCLHDGEKEAVDQIGSWMRIIFFFSKRPIGAIEWRGQAGRSTMFLRLKSITFKGKCWEEKERAKVEYFRSRYYFSKK